MADRLTSATLKGIWAGVTLSWDQDYQFDEASFRENLRKLVAARVHGIYTTGSTGEFHALDYDEFLRVVDILAEEVGPTDVPTQVGCHHTNTHTVVRMLKYVDSAGIGAGQVALPYWMELTEEEILRFWSDGTLGSTGST